MASQAHVRNRDVSKASDPIDLDAGDELHVAERE
jgi:hypothetical protein